MTGVKVHVWHLPALARSLVAGLQCGLCEVSLRGLENKGHDGCRPRGTERELAHPIWIFCSVSSVLRAASDALATGILSVNTAPWLIPGLAADSNPPCSLANCMAIARPKPSPSPLLYERKLYGSSLRSELDRVRYEIVEKLPESNLASATACRPQTGFPDVASSSSARCG